MLIFFLIVVIIAAILLVFTVLAQNPKGGGLSSTFGGSSSIIGARQTADFLEKATWYIAIGIVVIVLLTNVAIPNRDFDEVKESRMQLQIDDMAMPQNPSPQQQAAQQQDKPTE